MTALFDQAFYAQAVADAVGTHFERGHPSSQHVHDFLQAPGVMEISDQTQMAMFGLEALTEWRQHQRQPLRKYVRTAYTHWYETQMGDTRYLPHGLATKKEMHGFHAPGMTSMMGLQHLKKYGQPLVNSSNGSGATARLLPFVALLRHQSRAAIRAITYFSVQVTHGGLGNRQAALLFLKAADAALVGSFMATNWGHFLDAQTIDEVGDGRSALGCMQMAIWAVRHAESYEHLLELCICHPGQSDNVAALAGALWGLLGRGGWEKYLPHLRQTATLRELLERYESVVSASHHSKHAGLHALSA